MSSDPPISDYGIIGDCRSAALVSRAGSIDWLCWPRFDSPSLFGALLDRDRGGRFVVCPTGPYRTTRRYIGRTNVLETTFRTATGTARLVDLMPVASEQAKRTRLWANHRILRRVECVEGEVELEVVCDPRPDYGRTVPRLHDRGPLGLYYDNGGRALILRSDIPLTLSGDRGRACARVRLAAGERRYLSLVWAEREPAFIPPLGAEAERRIEATLRWWEEWASLCRYDGPYRDAVVRSALVLKLMTYAPSGAVVAAPTTSLPERVGGERNWDYRYCWLRDASLMLRSLFGLGYRLEAEAFMSWILHATQRTWPELAVLYDVYGESHLPERELAHLAGYRGSRPVRVGNDAHDQLQLDIYGEVLDAVYEFARRGGRIDRVVARRLVGLGEAVCRHWREPDEGIWEIRSGRRHHTFSKAMCWVALDRLLALHRAGRLQVPVERFAREREAIRDEIERRGYNERLGSYVSVLDGAELDASLLLLMRYGYLDPRSPRARGTLARVRARLGRGGLLYRYLDDDGLPPGEGAFGICSFWCAECAAGQGDLDGAQRSFEAVLAHANDLGLFAEEYDPDTGEALGNFPQTFTHVGLIDAALALEAAQAGAARPLAVREA
ncbi:MAG TPA: glycoside hydrolase family 15 protein [Woeseiaceae bacterium]